MGRTPVSLGEALAHLVDRFAPNGPGWVLSDEEQGRLLDSLLTGPIGDPRFADYEAWMQLTEQLQQLQKDPTIAASREVEEFVGTLSLLAHVGRVGGVDRVFRELASAFATKAAQAQRAAGDDTRERVLAAWLADVQAGRPDRGRSPRVARALRLPETTVKSAVSALRKAGRLQGQGAR